MATSKPRGVGWKNAEDVALCISVVTIGEDSDKAIGQEKKKCGKEFMECTLVASRAKEILDPEEGVKLVGERLGRLVKGNRRSCKW